MKACRRVLVMQLLEASWRRLSVNSGRWLVETESVRRFGPIRAQHLAKILPADNFVSEEHALHLRVLDMITALILHNLLGRRVNQPHENVLFLTNTWRWNYLHQNYFTQNYFTQNYLTHHSRRRVEACIWFHCWCSARTPDPEQIRKQIKTEF